MKTSIAKILSTCGVGYLPLAPGTWGSAVGVLIYLAAVQLAFQYKIVSPAVCFAITSIVFVAFALIAFWASSRTAESLGGKDPQIVVVDEVLGQLVTFLFVPFTFSWKLILAGFVLFRLFDIWKPYPVKEFEKLPGGIGICADDIVAGIYAGTCLAVLNVFVG
ncbi:MAG: phosphatidylglycerophosphatase A [Pyrinomonadaceae bacterium]|nr:phosphatidylglycerophosphatase A [Pyrinomonadaceae bacterium]